MRIFASYIISLLIIVPFGSFAGTQKCTLVFEREQISSWKSFEFSKPSFSDLSPKKFVFMVHGFSPRVDLNQVENPELYLRAKKRISASIISDSLRGTFGNYGLIFETDFNGLIQAFPYDAASWNFSETDIATLKKEPIKYSPDDLIRATKPTGYNELFFEPTAPHTVKVTGIFVKSFGGGIWFIDDKLKDKLISLGQKMNWPIIEIDAYGD